MFTRQDLLDALPRLVETPSLPMEVVEFDQFAFASPESEQTILAFHGLKRYFPSGVLFWVKSLQAQDWEERADYLQPYAESAVCLPQSEAEFFRLIADFSGSLRHPLPEFLAARHGFMASLKMHGEWNDIGAIAEFTEAFVAFYWRTTA